MMNILNEVRDLLSGVILCTLGVSSLYTNIQHDDGTTAIKDILNIYRESHDLPHSSFIGELL